MFICTLITRGHNIDHNSDSIVILITVVVVIIVFEVVNTSREFNIIRKSIPFVHYSMTEEMTSLFTNVRRLGEVESADCCVIWSKSPS